MLPFICASVVLLSLSSPTSTPISASIAYSYNVLLATLLVSKDTLYSGSVRTISVVIDCSYVPAVVPFKSTLLFTHMFLNVIVSTVSLSYPDSFAVFTAPSLL